MTTFSYCFCRILIFFKFLLKFFSKSNCQCNIVFSIFLDKALKEIVERVFQSNYFDSTHNHQNGLCEEEEAASAPTVEDQVAEAGEYLGGYKD